jgi:MFS transporter, PAT family, beta-lactamase induction signal transducer AmpG
VLRTDASVPAASRSPWAWVPSLYLAEGLPYTLVVTVSVIFYKTFGLSNARIAFYTGWLYLPWVLKPLWSPVVDLLDTRRRWIWAMQLLMGAALAGIALTLPTSQYVQYSLALFWLLAFNSATHDIAADGFYLVALTERDQSFFVGIRNTCFRVGAIGSQGGLVMLVGLLQERTGKPALAWAAGLALLAAVFLGLGMYHRLILPRPAVDQPGQAGSGGRFLRECLATFAAFFRKPGLGVLLLFLLFYRFGEAQLLKMVPPFLLDPRQSGGLGLATAEVGLVYGTVGMIALMLGGILGGVLVARDGLRAWLWPMVFLMHVPDAVFLWLAWAQPAHLGAIATCLALEQFGYGFGFTAYMLYMIHIARGLHSTAHYALCTGFMALGMMVPGLWSGWLQEVLGYRLFFAWVLLATIPGFVVTALIPLDREFGRKTTGTGPGAIFSGTTRAKP